MKTSCLHSKFNNKLQYLILLVCLFNASLCWSLSYNSNNSSPVVLSNLAGNIWIDNDGNSTYEGEPGPNGVLISLIDSGQDTVVAQTTTFDGKYEFLGVPSGTFQLRIDKSAFELGGPLFGQQSCVGVNDANNMVDNDDNGSDTSPNDILCSPFNLTNDDPTNDISIEYIDFCFTFLCEDQNEIAKRSCAEISTQDIICDINFLNDFCTIMPSDSSDGIQPNPLCDGFNTSENISWFAFAAAEGNYTLSVTPFDCNGGTLGQQGIQVGIYKDCSFSEEVFCSNFCTVNPVNISSGILSPGQVYYMYINGCDGNICNYQININGNATPSTLIPTDVCVFNDGAFECSDISYCLDSDITFQGQGVNFTGNFSWLITTISGDPYVGDTSPTTTDNLLTITIPTEGKYEVCLTEVLNVCSDSTWTGMLCREITTSLSVPVQMDEDFGEVFICDDGDLNTFSVNVFSNDDPNGDGDSGWNAPTPDYIFGLNVGIVYTDGCSYQQEFTISNIPPLPVEDVLISVCEEDLPITIDNLTFSVFAFGGQQTLVFDSIVLQNSQTINGCDSIINLTVEKLNVLQGAIEEPICTVDGIDLKFNYISDLSTDISFLDFEWRDPAGNILPTGSDPTSITAPFGSGNGTYTLSVTINKNGESCNYNYDTFVDIGSYLPPIPIISGPTIVCTGENTSIYTAQGNGEETSFIWSFPNSVASAVISGDTSEILTIDWTGSTGGQVIAIGQNECGQSDQTSIEVQVIPLVTHDFSIDTSVCIDNPVTIDFIGTGINIIEYTWIFDGGTVLSGSGMGPYQVSWDTPGEKFVSLNTTDNNGCLSNTTTKSIPVQIPLSPTAVNCNSFLGEVVFTWEIPLMVSGFEVNVLTGQTGGVFTSNSFTVSGLDVGEEVTIELLTKPEDPICGEFVSTTISCVGQDCSAPSIELDAVQSVCADAENITIVPTITSGETGTGVFSGPGIIDTNTGEFDPSTANVGVNTILYTFTSDVADCVGSKTISIEVFELPVASFTQDLDTLCISESLNLDYTGTINAEFFDWFFEDGVGSGLLTNQEVIFSSPGLKTLSLRVTKDDCSSIVASSTVFVEPELDDILIQCDTASTDFITFSWNEISGSSLFEIKVDNDPSFFSPNNTLTIGGLDENQEVIISITSLSTTSCPGSTSMFSCTTEMTPVDVETQNLEQVSIYPNPANEILLVDGLKNYDYSFVLYTIHGERINQGILKNGSIDVSNITTGLYLIRLTDEKSNLYKDFKFIKL